MRLPSCVSSWAASGRAKASVPPPAANGTMKVIGLSGHVWAWAVVWAWLATAETTAKSANRAHRTTLGFTAFSSGYCRLVAAIGGAIVFFASLVPGFARDRAGQRAPYRMQK